ncbi:MAG: hypoxanthine phosphoribosyltransferase [Planctomycetota bacterium]|jgi:hypoxanthine phosphoribosyltransferase
MEPTAQRPVAGRTLISSRRIHAEVAALGQRVRTAYAGKDLTVVCVLDGALVFTADLVRELDVPVRIETVMARSYRGGTTTPGELQMRLECAARLRGRHVLVVEDILDTGRTLAAVRRAILEAGPTSLRVAVLLDKPSRRVEPVHADFVGFEIPDVFVVGYGMDHDGQYRNLPDIRALTDREQESAAVS